MSAQVAAFLRRLRREQIAEFEGALVTVRLLKAFAESIKESTPSADDLAKLPKAIIAKYSLFVSNIGQIGRAAELWIALLEDAETAWVSAQSIHEQWGLILVVFDQAAMMRMAFIKHGAASTAEAAALLNEQAAMHIRKVQEKYHHDPKLVAAIASMTELTDPAPPSEAPLSQ